MYDVVIIGNGPAGVSAALYTKRANLKTLVIGKDGGALEKAENIENFYGFPKGISGKELILLGLEQLKNLNIEYLSKEVVSINYNRDIFIVSTSDMEIETKTIILATGTSRIKPMISGIEKFEGKGVSYCAICDGFFFKDKEVAVLGNGQYAISEMMELLPIVKKVNILTNGREKINFRDDRVDVLDKKVVRVSGKDRLEKVEFDDDSSIDVSAIFIAEGTASSVDFARRIGATTNGNNIVVDENFMTNVPGLFAAGDCVGGLLQVSKAVSDGSKAGIATINYLRKNQ